MTDSPISASLKPLPKVSIIIPARNEEANIETCLRSLVVQRGVTFEILVVNDGSTDRTQEIAESYTRVRRCPFIALNQFLLDVHVLDAPQPLPEGWTGKANAIAAGEAAAHGEWLLFTDADTEHLEGSLAAALAEAEAYHADLLSYSPEQITTKFCQHSVMPLIFGELASTYSPHRVADPAHPDAAANGQYLFVRAEAHRKIGGFASVATELLDDVSLARRYKQAGYRIRFRYGGEAVRTRMYRSCDDLGNGWRKNLALLFPNPRQLARKRRQEFCRLLVSFLLPLLWTLYLARVGTSGYWFLPIVVSVLWLCGLLSFASFYVRVARAHFPLMPTLLSIFGLPSFAALLRGSAKAHEEGRVEWRGRAYGTSGAAERTASDSK